MLRIFLSYARRDGGVAALRLRSELERARFSVWRDIEDIQGGQEWREQLRKAVREVDVVLVLLTPAAVASQYVTQEWQTALTLQKKVIPLLISQCEAPPELSQLQRRNLSREEAYSGELAALLNDLSNVSDAAWLEVQDEIIRLREGGELAAFHPILDKLQQWVSARVYPREIFRATLWLIQQINADARHGRSITAMMEAVISGEYVQPNWEVHTLFQEHSHVFQHIFSLFRRDVRAGEGIPVPIVLLVMNAAEAQELESEAAFDGYPDELRDEFRRLKALLNDNGVADWIGRYRPTPEEWRPFGGADDSESIAGLISQSLALIRGYDQPLVPSIKDVRTLTGEANRPLLRELRQEGCVLVIDTISIHHPTIQRAFQRSALDMYPNTSVVTVAPVLSAFDVVRQMTVVLRLRLSEMEFTLRRLLDVDEDYGVCEEISDEQRLKRWLLDRARKMQDSRLNAQTGIRSQMFLGGPRP